MLKKAKAKYKNLAFCHLYFKLIPVTFIIIKIVVRIPISTRPVSCNSRCFGFIRKLLHISILPSLGLINILLYKSMTFVNVYVNHQISYVTNLCSDSRIT